VRGQTVLGSKVLKSPGVCPSVLEGSTKLLIEP
jgi:hypothetical protein